MTDPLSDIQRLLLVERDAQLRRIILESQQRGRQALDLLRDIDPAADVDRKPGVPWDDAEPFPLTPMECYWIMRGWCVKPKTPIKTTSDTWQRLPGRLEMIGGYISHVF